MEEWLRSIGLDEHHAAFRDQGVTLDQVADLTDEDLRELGLNIGDRKRFRRAVTALLTPPNVAPRQAAPVLETTGAERRPLTIMFVDLVNSSGLGELLEPEDLLEVIRCYRGFAGSAINRFGGMMGRLIGDGLIAYFCYPVATENDPERAVRAALEIVRGIGTLETPAGTALNVHIGIATGRVIVGDLFAGGQQDIHSIIGSTPNLAARLQGFAPPGGILIAEETYARVRSMFVCESLGQRDVRGFVQAHGVWRVIGDASVRATAPRLTPFFGRKAELAILAERWDRARVGEHGTVLVIGQAGIGKSRLIEHFLAAHIDDRARVVRLAGRSIDEDSALYPVIAFLRMTAQLEPDDPPDVQIAKLYSVLVGDEAVKRGALPVLAVLAGIPSDDAALRALSPEQLRERMLSVLIEQVLLPALDKPLCLLVEDVHWLDPTSQELAERMMKSIAGRPVMILLTVRDGFEAPWMTDCTTTVMRLAPLTTPMLRV